jgi:alpha,alpha-trehalose phosphorylase (configuration-retaining)
MTDYIISELQAYERKNFCKFIGAGLPYELMEKAPKLCSRLWAELDTVPIAMHPDGEGHSSNHKNKEYWDLKCVDEQADSMARKCIMYVSYFVIDKQSLMNVI